MFYNGDWSNGITVDLTPEECLTKNDIAITLCPKTNFPPKCSLYSSWGTKVTSCAEISPGESLFMVHEERVFMLPTRGVGDRREVFHVPSPIPSNRIILETLRDIPRMFKIENFLSPEEGQRLLSSARDYSDDPPLPPSHTNNNDAPNTAKILYNPYSQVAVTLKRRAFDLLGIHPVDDSLVEGFQVRKTPKNTSKTHLIFVM